MNANQVVIVMDRAEAEETTNALGFAQGNGYDNPANGSAQMVIDAALDRDFGALVEVVARAIASGAKSNCFERLDTGLEIRRVEQQCDRYRKQARSVLAVLGEEGGPE